MRKSDNYFVFSYSQVAKLKVGDGDSIEAPAWGKWRENAKCGGTIVSGQETVVAGLLPSGSRTRGEMRAEVSPPSQGRSTGRPAADMQLEISPKVVVCRIGLLAD